jgi:hypothetical protein
LTLYHNIIRSSECKRCHLQINYKEAECPHCLGLSDAEAMKLKKYYKHESVKLNAGLGRTFKLLFVGTIFLMLLLYLVSNT